MEVPPLPWGVPTLTSKGNEKNKSIFQCAKKLVSNSPGLVDFALGLVNSVNLPDGQVMSFEEFK